MTAAASTPKGERRRAALVEAAAQLLGEGGFDAIRHRAVAERADLPLASTTYYFDSLDELVIAAVEHYSFTELAESRKRIEAQSDPAKGVDGLLDLILFMLLGDETGDTEADNEAVVLRYERLVATGRRKYLRPVMRKITVEFNAQLGEIFSRAGRPMPPSAVERLVALVDGAVVNALIEIDPDPRGVAKRMLLAELA
ncbi:DNA-binding transcriptional regulator YbjK [Amycolatopsis xylanica]|uniref:DNA-binding transcriptional regulator YbjK n=1 Tax=Amycolatopsis xylanica TaxID=589385 RepID=A0A1H2ZXP6_9PSEU|nr:TetR family transcriptional regulator [Amycolatopsis xylanica]SDX22260.1 DNA-binding transcriptional regulator YbjK [Amycolatopsis xylanica]